MGLQLFSGLVEHWEATIHVAALAFAVCLAYAGFDRVEDEDASSKIRKRVLGSLKNESNVVEYINSLTLDDGKRKISGVAGPEYQHALYAICLKHKIPNDLDVEQKITKRVKIALKNGPWKKKEKAAFQHMCRVLKKETFRFPVILTILAALNLFALAFASLWIKALPAYIPIITLVFDAYAIGYMAFCFWRNAAIASCGEKIGKDGQTWFSQSTNKVITGSVAKPISDTPDS